MPRGFDGSYDSFNQRTSGDGGVLVVDDLNALAHGLLAEEVDQAVGHGAEVTLQKQKINDLNVFPVPDGDTGTNMSLTIAAAAAELKKSEPRDIGQAASITGVHVGGLGEHLVAHPDGLGQHIFHVVVLPGGLLGPLGGQAGDGEHSTLGGLHHRAVVHTNIPGSALTEAQKYGTLELAKIENMRTQAEREEPSSVISGIASPRREASMPSRIAR